MAWIMTICTAGWVMCGQEIVVEYKTEQQCYAAINEIYKRQNPSDFKYIVCSQNGIKHK